MNFLGHTFVALATGDEDPHYLLGAALPDLVSMAGVRLDRVQLDGSLGRGIRCHRAADSVFHAHPEFRRGTAALRAELMRGGLRRGAARAVGHAGWELILDGTLVDSPVEAAFLGALQAGEQAECAIAGPDRPRWAQFLARWHRRSDMSGVALHYDDPAWVADRLYSMLSERRLLAFSGAELPAVRRALAAHAPRIAAVADDVLADVTAGVTGAQR